MYSDFDFSDEEQDFETYEHGSLEDLESYHTLLTEEYNKFQLIYNKLSDSLTHLSQIDDRSRIKNILSDFARDFSELTDITSTYNTYLDNFNLSKKEYESKYGQSSPFKPPMENRKTINHGYLNIKLIKLKTNLKTTLARVGDDNLKNFINKMSKKSTISNSNINQELSLRELWQKGNYTKFDRIETPVSLLTYEETKLPKYEKEAILIERKHKAESEVAKVNKDRDRLFLDMVNMDILDLIAQYSNILSVIDSKINRLITIDWKNNWDIGLGILQEIVNNDFKLLQSIIEKYESLVEIMVDRFGQDTVNNFLLDFKLEDKFYTSTSNMLINIKNTMENIGIIPHQVDKTLHKIFSFFENIKVAPLHLDVVIERVIENQMTDQQILEFIVSFKYEGIDNDIIKIMLMDDPWFIDEDRINKLLG